MIVCYDHSQKVIIQVKFTENVILEGLPVSHTRLQWINCKLYTYNANNFIFIINIFNRWVCLPFVFLQIA